MAEVVALVSGVLTIAHTLGELAKITIKLKSLWDEIDAVPRRVQSLVEEIRILGQLLSHTDDQLNHSAVARDIWNTHYATSATHYCRQVHDTMSSLVMDLRDEIDATPPIMRTFKIAKVTLKKSKIMSLEQQLRGACGLLQMSLQCYSIALSSASYDTNAKILSLLQESATIRLADYEWIHSQKRASDLEARDTQRMSRSRLNPRAEKTHISRFIGAALISSLSSKDLVVVTILPARWLRCLAWGITICYGLQQISIRYYNIRPNDSDIFLCVRNQDLAGMIRLFEDRRASPFDRDEDGLSLLHYAASTRDTTLCQRLLELGLDTCVDEEIDDNFSPKETAFLVSLWNKSEAVESRVAYMELFQRFSSSPYPEEDCRLFSLGCSSGECDLALLSSFQRLIVPFWYDLPACRRFETAREYCCNSLPTSHPNPKIVQLLVKGNTAFLPVDLSQSVGFGVSLIHTIAISFGRVSRNVEEQTNRFGDAELIQWQREAANAISLSQPIELHNVERVLYKVGWVGTPLVSLIKGCAIDSFEGIADAVGVLDQWKRVTAFALSRWLEQMKSCAVDLRAYGMKEKEIFDQSLGGTTKSLNFVLEFRRWVASEQKHARQSVFAHLRGFEFGPAVGDWSLTWEIDPIKSMSVVGSDEGSRLAPDMAHPVPGAWID